MRKMGRKTRIRWSKRQQRLLWRSAIILIGLFFIANITKLHILFSNSANDSFRKMHFRFEREPANAKAPKRTDRPTWRVSLRNPKQSKRERLRVMESDLASKLASSSKSLGGQKSQENIVSCEKEHDYYRTTIAAPTTTDRRCDAYLYNNVTGTTATGDNNNGRLVFYNPLPRDQFLCGGKVLLGPNQVGDYDVEKCSYGGRRPLHENGDSDNDNDNLAVADVTSHSFPYPPTFENRGTFPGIKVPKKAQREDDTFSSGVDYSGGEKKFDTQGCDVKCRFEGSKPNLYIYGTDASFEYSMEGEAYYSKLKINKNAWKKHKFYATTSLQSEVPHTYFSMWWGTPGSEYEIGLQTPPVPFSEGIKGAVFLARNCNSKNNREQLVRDLMATSLRVDSLSSCLKRGSPPPGVGMKNKTKLIHHYMFYLAFENQRTDDYITEKFWNALMSGTIPVYFGAPNIKKHLPFKGAIFVDDFKNMIELSEYLIKVSNDEDLYNSYHAWRNQSYPPAFVEMHNRTLHTSQCRMCMWGHAYKYGLGWNHKKQLIEPVILPRETCLDENGLLRSPAVESWSSSSSYWQRSMVDVTALSGKSSQCSSTEEESVARVGSSDLIRKVWSSDGCTDFYIGGDAPSGSLILTLTFPMEDHGPLRAYDARTAWIQNDVSRVSLVVDRRDGAPEVVIAATGGRVEVTVDPGALPVRLRIIVENLDLHHDGALDLPSYYGEKMSEDVWNHPEVFALEN
mmetsp:Transcript_21930/g.41410  ORF Transcript_21930/g.41410 Transcript_21930/m.41410 type:complete len:737 (-) Transcript_21930:284-2494(-)